MLTYATLEDFKIAKHIRQIKPGSSGISAEQLREADDKIVDYLRRATRYINRFTRREFFPWRETRKFAVPHSFLDLQMRRFLTADLYMDQDLLYPYVLSNADGAELVLDTDFFLLPSNIMPKFAVQLKFPNFWGGQFTDTLLIKSFDEPVVLIDGLWGYHDTYNRANEAWIDTEEILGTGGIDDNQTDITVDDPEGEDYTGRQRFLPGHLLMIEEEMMEVVSYDAESVTKTITVKRGTRGTEAVEHGEDVPIYRWQVVEDIVEVCLQIAKTWREADTAAGGRLGVNDMSAGVEIGIPADPLNVMKMYQRSLIGF